METNRLVAVSNRLPNLKSGDEWREGKIPSAGGLVSALLPVMDRTGQGIWLGWSGKTAHKADAGEFEQKDYPFVRLVGMDLTERELEAYYNGFCNRTLWPMFHGFQSRVRLDADEQEVYFKVNERFSKALSLFLEPGDTVWIHDYHMAPLAKFLRRDGFNGPIGFFLHIPFPPLEMIEILPDPLGFMDSWLYYDLVGFHTERFLENYFEVMERLMIAVRDGDRLLAGNRGQRALACPIGIDTSIYDPAGGEERGNKSRKGIKPAKKEIKVALGVDRLDYTKGIPERMASFEYFLKNYPSWKRKVSLVQICAPSRTRVKEYVEQKQAMDALVGRINGEMSEYDWEPIRYLYRSYGQADLARFYRDADVALITPLRDGMNLVAMEYVCSQDPECPGVPVLSKFTGAAEYLSEAVLVNPYLPESVAEGLDRALSMPLSERKDRHQAMMEFVTNNSSIKWATEFIDSLGKTHKQNLAGHS